MADNDKALIASSEFDPAPFIAGIDAMTESLKELSAQEDIVKKKLTESNQALAANKAAMKETEAQITQLDKTSKTYSQDLQKLTEQQNALKNNQKDLQGAIKVTKAELTGINQSANNYKTALENINAVAKKVSQENKGRSIFDVASLNQQVQKITQIAGNFRNIFQGKIDTSELDRLEAELAQSGDEFKNLGTVIDFVEEKLKSLDPNSEEFAQLNQVVSTGREVLDAYGKSQSQTEVKTKSLRARLAEMRTTLVQMEDAGQSGTKEFQDLQVAAGKLADSIGDAQQRIKVLSSDTKNLDFGIGAIRGIAGAFGLAEGAATLFGLKNEDVEKSIARLNSIMVILNGLQEIQILLQKQSVVAIVGQEIATKAAAAAQAVYAAIVGTTTGALKAFRVALLTSGIGVVVIALGFLISAFLDASEATEELTKNQKLLIDVNKEAAQEGGKEIARLELLRVKLTDVNVPQKERVKLAKDYNKTADEGNKIDLKQIDNTEQINILINAQIELIKKRAFARAAENKLAELATQRLQSELDLLRATGAATIDEAKKIAAGVQKELGDKLNLSKLALGSAPDLGGQILSALVPSGLTKAQEAKLNKFGGSLNAFLKSDKEFNEALKFLNGFINPASLAAPTETADTKTIENVYAQKLKELLRKLAEVQRKTLQESEGLIRTQFQEKLADELFGVDKLKAEGKLTTGQANNLKSILKRINQLELNEDLGEFRKKRIEVQKQIDDELTKLREEDANQRIALLRDDLARQQLEIENGAAQATAALERARQNLLDKNTEQKDKGLIDPETAQLNADQINSIYDRLLDDLTEQTAQKGDELAFNIFSRAQDLVSQLFAPTFTRLSESTTAEIQKVTQAFVSGQIKYEEYQRQLTAILAIENRKRIELQIAENTQLLEGVRRRIAAETDPSKKEALQAQELQLRNEIDGLNRQIADADSKGAQDDQKDRDERLAELSKYASAVGSIVSAVADFWTKVNEAEQKSLEKSIALQQQRVEAAVRIAERGNAEYLRLEEDRLNELQVKQENAARRQLAINAVLQTSQALVAFTTALAQGIATGGPLGGIAIAASVIGLIGAGYGIIQALQNQTTQRLFKGTKSVERGQSPDGIDTVPAMLTAGEAVIPVNKNREFAPVIGAIMDGTISPASMNAFVNHATGRRQIPGVAFDAMAEKSEAAGLYSGKLIELSTEQNRRLTENNELLSSMHKTLKGLGISVNMDQHGIAIGVMKAIERHSIQKKV